ncbi:cytochrome b/b6 domain-containing protein [Thalassococcus sp. S3]|uniref:cytochrome b/b6 domain-containing protein n=1 Tax=Thalassococcus sp. S3 TaxID=2017482 RepID=UPI001023F53F|nr:cytochrome b/b6 domain-containing protein [Thalassococcus sp. S3]QBF32288.1 cytochrome [Thalassococcus sp. S3]
MSLTNTHTTYGAVTKTFHWLTALLILTAIPLGIVANNLPYETSEELARKAWLFSFHKTVGITAFFVALARIAWAIAQPRPGLLNGDKKVESLLAETVHWLLYGSLLLVPLSGWIHHAATTGFAPIWWPFGQDLPFIPKDDGIASTFAGLHMVFERVLVVAIALHAAGALKHHFIDKDFTLLRMLPNRRQAPNPPAHTRSSLPLGAAIVLWGAALGIGGTLGVYDSHAAIAPVAELEEVQSDWQVEDGTLGITVTQLGSQVEGTFADWTAAITFAERDDPGPAGSVDVTVAIGSLTLGSVTGQALGPDFFDVERFPTATFTAEISRTEDGYVANGPLAIRDASVPVSLPFTLVIAEDGTATMSGNLTLNRIDFGIGASSQPDEANVGFGVDVNVALTATQAQPSDQP